MGLVTKASTTSAFSSKKLLFYIYIFFIMVNKGLTPSAF